MVADRGLERTQGDWMTGCLPIIRGVYASHPPSGSGGLAAVIRLPGRSHHPYRATGAAAPAASAEVGRAVVIR